MSFAVIVPTLNAGDSWSIWIDAIKSQYQNPDDVLVIDSESSDETVMLAKDAGFEVYGVRKDAFDHGGTRRLATEMCSGHEFVIFLTQDAILADSQSLKNILSAFQDDKVAAVCGRQLPRKQASPIESHSRIFNYSSDSYVRSIKDVNRFGMKTAFLSNSYAAYRISALQEIGGFPEEIIFGEDMYVAAKFLLDGYKIAYAADACVHHSHAYTILQELKRYFDMGVFHAREPWIREALGSAENKGTEFIVSELGYLWKQAIWSIPEALFRNVVRYAGFRMGLIESFLPLQFKRYLSMNYQYFVK